MNNKFSENLKKIRKDNNLSQEQLADELGVSRQAISKWESAVAYPEMDKIITLCEKFNLNIDDLLHKDIREIKGEEESKKNLNKFVDDFLNFITNTINMFSNMSFKSKIKCLFEQCVIALILFITFFIIGNVIGDSLFSIFGFLTDKVYFALRSIFNFIYIIFGAIVSVVIMLHIFKTRYLDYYEKIKKETTKDTPIGEIDDDLEDLNKEEKTQKKNKILFKKNENKIIIRDPKHTEYRFMNVLFKGIVGIIKFFTLCFSLILFITLISLFVAFIISFLTYKTGIFFIGLLVSILSASVINIILILLLLNFVFNRKNDKKKMIWSFIISLILFGIGCGMVIVGILDFEYIENNKDNLKTEQVELDMRSDLIFGIYPVVEYIESDNSNIKIEYSINKYCDLVTSNFNDSVIHLWGSCDNPIKLVKEVIHNFNDKKIISVNNELNDVKIYTTKENIETLKINYKQYTDEQIKRENIINSYENKIGELEQQLDDYIQKEWDYKNEIQSLKDQITYYENK